MKEQWAEEALEKVRKKIRVTAEKNRDKIPYKTDENGDYDDNSDIREDGSGLDWWTNGFWGGTLWRMFEDTGDKAFAEIAAISEKKMEACFDHYYGLNHDVGFMYMLTAGADYRLTGNKESLRYLLHAANLLAGRFNPAGNYIRAWNDVWGHNTGWAIIDCMMNLSLLYYASEITEDPRFRNIAKLHADTVIDAFVRKDGSCCHIVEFDPETGKRIKSMGGQGYGTGSSWTRGQAWGLYGFVISYIHTGIKKYLDTAVKIADYCIKNIPESGLIPIDFRQPEEPALEDCCGACIMACGFIELSKQFEGKEGAAYLEAGKKILKTIVDQRCDFSLDCDAFVQNCSVAYHSDGHNVTMNYADYFFIEGLHKLEDIGSFYW
ncbi:MAG: glycoside hydrolase family 88 protein [Lachnospiraceae bacterium]|nr:glycoside hydrolase family 88 protein [Lachnospiraceae bacterium]